MYMYMYMGYSMVVVHVKIHAFYPCPSGLFREVVSLWGCVLLCVANICLFVQVALEAQIRQRLDLQSAHKDYVIMKERKKEAEKIEEEEFRIQMMAKFAEDDRIELMNAQKRRMKQLEHRRAVEKLIIERQQDYQKQKVINV